MERTRRDRERDKTRDKDRERQGSRDRDRDRGKGRDRDRERDGEERRRERDGEEKRRERSSKDPTKDHHRRHLEKLMEHPEKPVAIPESSREKKPREPPEFVRFYMGSSAGAGSEVFHVYRHLRRRENDRQDYISTKAQEERLEDDFQQTLATHKADADARTAKKRAKRLKRKQRQKVKKREGKAGSEKSASSTAHGSGTEEGDEEGGEEGDEEGDEGGGGEAMASGGSDAEEEAHFVIGGK